MSASVLTRRSIEGDQATSRDADRIRAAGARALQINTGAGCHLDAEMIERALPSLRPEPGSVLVMPQFVLAAAARMTAATSFGLDCIGTWLVGSAVVVALITM